MQGKNGRRSVKTYSEAQPAWTGMKLYYSNGHKRVTAKQINLALVVRRLNFIPP